MSGEIYVPGKIANGASIDKFYFVKQDTAAEDVALCGAAGAMLGISQNEPGDNEPVAIIAAGSSFLTVDGSGTAIAVNDHLKSDASGRGVKVASDGELYGAIALEASAAANNVIRVIAVPAAYGYISA